MSVDRTRRPTSSRDAAEAAFKAATTKPAELPPRRPTIPNAKELVSLRIDRAILDHFQEAGPGWQDRTNEVLRKAIGKWIGTAGCKHYRREPGPSTLMRVGQLFAKPEAIGPQRHFGGVGRYERVIGPVHIGS